MKIDVHFQLSFFPQETNMSFFFVFLEKCFKIWEGKKVFKMDDFLFIIKAYFDIKLRMN